jgi:hypothetical protein
MSALTPSESTEDVQGREQQSLETANVPKSFLSRVAEDTRYRAGTACSTSSCQSSFRGGCSEDSEGAAVPPRLLVISLTHVFILRKRCEYSAFLRGRMFRAKLLRGQFTGLIVLQNRQNLNVSVATKLKRDAIAAGFRRGLGQ